jgi:parallel beta-helix repeat protein
MSKILVSSIIIGLILTSSILIVNAKICRPYIYVDDDNIDGPWYGTLEHPYRFIQDAVNNSISGDTVFVLRGSYDEFVWIGSPSQSGSSIRLVGQDRDSTFIKGVVSIYNTNDTTVSGFTFPENNLDDYCVAGFSLKNSHNNKIENNIIIDRENDFWLSGIYLTDSSSDNTITKNSIIGNNAAKGFYAVELRDGSNDNVVSENIITGNSGDLFGSIGIYVRESFYNVITGNIVKDNTGNFFGSGIELKWSCYNIISENNFENNVFSGIHIFAEEDDLHLWYNCYDNVITKNIIKDNTHGIYLFECLNNTISDNDISSNNIGLELEGANKSLISANTISDNNKGIEVRVVRSENDGTILKYSKENKITENNIVDNLLWGIHVDDDVSENHFFHNNFENNGGYALGGNAKDEGSNTWDDGIEMGNYWDDYFGWDLNRDGIGDIPYNIPNNGNQDRYPLMGSYPDVLNNLLLEQNNQFNIQSQQTIICSNSQIFQIVKTISR